MNKGGRPSKLTPEMHEAVIELLRRGNYLETAALAVGVDKATIRLWCAKGKEAKSGKYRKFYAAVREAIARAEVRDLDVINQSTSSDWRAAAWRLEHRYPQRWGKRAKTKHEVTGKGGAPLSAPQAVIYLPDNGRMPKEADE
jgi:transposase